jgi:protein-arginine kinase activator protein McsA
VKIKKKCYKCNKKRALSAFTKNKSKYDGLNSMCRDCTKEYQTKYMKSIRGKSVRHLYQVSYLKRKKKK